MLTALVLICLVAVTPDLRDCTRYNATAVIAVEATSILPSLNAKTARSWRGILPFTHLAREGRNDSHRQTAGIAGRTRRRGRVAARGARAAVGGRFRLTPVEIALD